MLVKLGETVQLAPAEAPSRSVAMPMNQEVVKTEADIVKSREVIAEAVKRLGIQPEEGSLDRADRRLAGRALGDADPRHQHPADQHSRAEP